MSFWDDIYAELEKTDREEVEWRNDTPKKRFLDHFGADDLSHPLANWKRGHLGLEKLHICFMGDVVQIHMVQNESIGALRSIWPSFIEYFSSTGVEKIWVSDHCGKSYDIWGEVYGFDGKKGDSHRELVL